MLSFTAEVESVLRWFEATHEPAVDMGGVRWRRIGLPGPGSVGEQDARLMDAMEFVRYVSNDVLRPVDTKKKGTDE